MPPLTSTRMLAGSLAAIALVLLVFVTWPSIDLTVAALFAQGGDRFVGQTPLGNALRDVFSVTPFVVLLAMIGLYGARRAGRWRGWAPNGAAVVMLVLSFALGPGVLVNLVLKDHSHRPRPVQVTAFGGTDAFRPVLRFDGACSRNCSFVSGEASSAFWTLAPAVLAPGPWAPAAVSAALVFGIATGLLRMAFGGHFLSDTILAGLLTWLVIVLCWRLVRRFGPSEPGPAAPPDAVGPSYGR